jgi:hypothetical protein
MGASGAWSVTSTDGGVHQLTGVSCQSAQRCVAIDNVGDVLIGTPAPPRTLSVTLEGTGSGTVTGAGISCPSACSSSQPNGASVVLTASPNAGSTFLGWGGGACTGTGACAIAMNSDSSVTASFAAKAPATPTAAGGAGHSPGGGPGPGSAAASTATPTAKAAVVTVAGSILALPSAIGMPLHCWAKAGSCPPTTFTLSIVETLRGSRVLAVAAAHAGLRHRRVIIGIRTVTLSAGQTATVKVLLNRAGRAQLHSLRRFSALLEISSRGGPVLWKQTVGVFEHSKRKHR